MRCDACGEEVLAERNFCPNCGAAIKQSKAYAHQPYEQPLTKKLYRSRQNRMVAGVCAGLAYYFKTDPTIVRIIWLFSIIFAGTGFFAYIIAAIIIPEAPPEIDQQYSEYFRQM